MNRLIKIILIAILIPVAIYFFPAAFGGDTEFFLVSGQSMHPTILDGSLVITKQSSPYEVGDIVGYYSKESKINVVHRIIDVDDDGLFTIKGDNNQNKDAGVYSTDDILGEVVFATPFVGELLGLLRNPLVLIISAIVLVAIQAEQKRRKKKKEMRRRILLGIPKPDPNEENLIKNKPKKPSYSLFAIAMLLNILTYVLLQIGISYNQILEGDQVTGFLFKILAPSFASTLSFGLYSIFILGLYFVTKNNYQKTRYETKSNRKSNKTVQVLIGKNVKPIPALTQFLTMMFCIMVIFHLIAIAPEIVPLINP